MQYSVYVSVFLVESDSLWLSPSNCSMPGSSVHGIFQARILERVAISSFRGFSQPRDWTCISSISYIGRQILYHCATWELHNGILLSNKKDVLITLIQATTCMKLICIMLSERSQIQKASYCVIPFILIFFKWQGSWNAEQISGCLGLGVGTAVDYNDVAQGIVLDVVTVKIVV